MSALSSQVSVAPFFDEDLFTQPATFTNAAGAVREINVIFDTDYQGSFVGETEVSNARPAATCKESDVFDADNDCTLVVHDYLEDAEGNTLTDESGDPLIGEAIGTYKITRVRRDGTGVVVLDLSTD